jgi:hypothetical protein
MKDPRESEMGLTGFEFASGTFRRATKEYRVPSDAFVSDVNNAGFPCQPE